MTPSEWQQFLYNLCREVVMRLPHNFSLQDREDLIQQAILYVLSHPNISQITYDLPLTQHQKNKLRCIIKRNLYPHIRKMTGDRTAGSSDLGLVSRSSLTKIKQVLGNHPLLKEYILVYQCFNEVKNSLNVTVDQLINEHFELMCDRYNHLSDYPRINAQIIKQYLENISRIIRDYSTPRTHSIDADKNLDLPSHHIEISPESVEMREKFFNILDRIDTKNSPKLSRKIISLYYYYGLNINIPEISKILDVNPGTVSREKTQVKKYIFTQMRELYHIPKGEIFLNQLDELDVFLEEYYHSWLKEITRYSIEILPSLWMITPWEPLLYLTDRIAKQLEQKFNSKIDDFVWEKIYTWIENNLQYI